MMPAKDLRSKIGRLRLLLSRRQSGCLGCGGKAHQQCDQQSILHAFPQKIVFEV
jgi:hypothetical protein